MVLNPQEAICRDLVALSKAPQFGLPVKPLQPRCCFYNLSELIHSLFLDFGLSGRRCGKLLGMSTVTGGIVEGTSPSSVSMQKPFAEAPMIRAIPCCGGRVQRRVCQMPNACNDYIFCITLQSLHGFLTWTLLEGLGCLNEAVFEG